MLGNIHFGGCHRGDNEVRILIVNAESNTGMNFGQLHKAMSRKRVKNGMTPLPNIPPIIEKDGADPIIARINHSRWIADCPFCNGAEFVPIDNPKFMCQSCWNDGSLEYIAIEMPNNRKAIETALNKRPRIETRNWEGETVKQLRQENIDMGVRN